MSDKQQLAAMGAEMAEQQQQPMCMAKRIEELEAQVRVMAESLREAISVLSSINHGGEHEVHIEGDEPAFWQRGEWVDWAKSEVLPKLQPALAGKQPVPVVLEGWQLEDLDNDCIVVRKDGVGFYVASFNAENIASTILHALASDMLAAAPKLEAK